MPEETLFPTGAAVPSVSAVPAPEGQALPGRRRGRPPAQCSDETRARIIRAAWRCFGSAGYAGTSMSRVAREAGVTSRAIYHYAESKRALFAMAADAAYARYGSEVAKRALVHTDAVGRVHGFVDVFRALYKEDPSLVAFLSLSLIDAQRCPELAATTTRARTGALSVNRVLVRQAADGREFASDVDPDGAVALLDVFGAGLTLVSLAGHDDSYLAMLDVLDRLVDGTLFIQTRSAGSGAPQGP